MANVDYRGFSSVLIDRREAAASSPSTSPTTKVGYDSSGRWRPTADDSERRAMSFEQRWLHSAANPANAVERDRKRAERDAENAPTFVALDRYGRKINSRGELVR